MRLDVDHDGRLTAIDAPIDAINVRAGGRIGLPLALPALASVVRLVLALAVPVARRVIVASGESDIELHVDAVPTPGGATLTATGWTERRNRASWLVAQPGPTLAGSVLPFAWASDATLQLTALTLDPAEIIDFEPAALVGQPLTRFVRLIEDEAGDLPILDALASGRGFEGQRAVRRDRPDAEILLSAQPVTSADGRVTGFEGRAVTALAVATVLPAEGFAERLGSALRRPLDRIIAGADHIALQANGPLRRDYADYAGDIASAARHLLALVDDLGDLDDVEQPTFSIPGEAIDLADLVRRAAGLLSVRAADRNVRLDRPEADETLSAIGDFRRVLQILVNLIGNAVRYSPPGGMVWLRTERDGDTAVVIVADMGKGIDPADQARIFEKFERVDPTEPGGSGLGLYISRQLARAMGGDITVDSAPGQGARFMLTLAGG